MSEHRDESNRLTIDFHHIKSSAYSKVTKEIVTEFELEAASDKTVGLDEMFQDFKRNDEVIGLEWDNWSGYIVNAKTEQSDPLVRDIGAYICSRFS